MFREIRLLNFANVEFLICICSKNILEDFRKRIVHYAFYINVLNILPIFRYDRFNCYYKLIVCFHTVIIVVCDQVYSVFIICLFLQKPLNEVLLIYCQSMVPSSAKASTLLVLLTIFKIFLSKLPQQNFLMLLQ